MKHQEATREFFRVVILAMAVFLIASYALAWLDESRDATSSVLIAVALVPIIALLLPFWAMWRFVMKADEFLRLIHIKALLFGTVTILVIASGWGYLEAYAGMPALPVFWLNPIFWLTYALAASVLTRREGFPI